jgi:predicted RNase H-like HicB family nuclease
MSHSADNAAIKTLAIWGDSAIICSSEEKPMQYTVFIRKAPDGFYIASSPLIPEAHAQGKTDNKYLANAMEVLELCLEFRRQRGEEIPEEAHHPVP